MRRRHFKSGLACYDAFCTTRNNVMHNRPWIIFSLVAGISLGLCLGVLSPAAAQTEPPDMPPMPQGLDPPPTVYPPTQVSLGAQDYYQICMACHGDKGQGLTDGWREALDLEDQNCWQSRCHAANYPPGGFVFPKVVPAAVGPGVRARFATALDLYNYLKSEMPFQAPGSLSDEQYWRITAFLVSANGVNLGKRPLDAQTAAQISLREPPATELAPVRPLHSASVAPLRSLEIRWVGLLFIGLVAVLLFLAAIKKSSKN